MKRLLSLSACCLFAACAARTPLEPSPAPIRPVHTYSIVAHDPETGELGVAVQSHWFSVGALVPWAEAGVGAVATQSFVNPAFGPNGLAAMRGRVSAPDALNKLIALDEGAAVRQVAMIDSHGRAAAHTGERCIQWAGHHVGKGYSVQANMMLNERVVPAMAKAFEGSQKGELAERLLAALAAAQAAGGDIRGQQSAALLVVSGKPTGDIWRDRLVDLRVEDHASPVEELQRLYAVHQAYAYMNAGDAALEEGDMRTALAKYARAAELQPESVEIAFWNAFTLATNGHMDAAVPIFQRAFAADANWIELLKRLPAAGLTDDATVAQVLERARSGY
jgi:uncharacterized Ntn-hydrolase superfamily protein